MKCHICIKEISRYKAVGNGEFWTHQCGSHLYLTVSELQRQIIAYTFLCPNDPLIINGGEAWEAANTTTVFEISWGNLTGPEKKLFTIPRFLPLLIDDRGVLKVSEIINKVKRYLPYL